MSHLKKTAIAMAVAGVMAAPLAQADVTIKGLITPSINFGGMDGYTTAPVAAGGTAAVVADGEMTAMADNQSSIGFAWEEDLGNGNKVVGFVDMSYDPSEPGGGGEIDSRDQYVGFAGGWGKIVFGSTSTSYKSSGAAIDPLWRTAGQARASDQMSTLHSGSDGLRGRQDNMIRYDSPSMNGFKAIGWMSLQDAVTDDHGWGAGLHYSNGPLFASVDYITDDSISGGEDDAFKAAAKYTFGNFAIWGHYEMDGGLVSQSNLTAIGGSGVGDSAYLNVHGGGTYNGTALAAGDIVTMDDGDYFYVGGQATFGNNFLVLTYGQRDDADVAVNGVAMSGLDTGSETWGIVAGHSFSKRTVAYVGYVAAEYSKDAPEVVTTTTTGTTYEGANGDVDNDVFTVGIRHKF